MGAPTQIGSGGKGNVTTPGQGGQPAFGQPSQQNQSSNQYGNTIGGWDNASIQPQQTSGKGSSGSNSGSSGKSWQPFQSSWTPPVQPATNVQTNVQPNVQPVSQYDYTGSGY